LACKALVSSTAAFTLRCSGLIAMGWRALSLRRQCPPAWSVWPASLRTMLRVRPDVCCLTACFVPIRSSQPFRV
jgi:hypothetical protein